MTTRGKTEDIQRGTLKVLAIMGGWKKDISEIPHLGGQTRRNGFSGTQYGNKPLAVAIWLFWLIARAPISLFTPKYWLFISFVCNNRFLSPPQKKESIFYSSGFGKEKNPFLAQFQYLYGLLELFFHVTMGWVWLDIDNE